MAVVGPSSSGAASRDLAQRRQGQSSLAVANGPKPKMSEWTGVRYRRWDRWAAEIRVPRTRSRLWIGTFDHDLQAALAYDAAIFCFYGERLPRPRKFNFPAAPRPDIPEYVRVRLTVANVKAIAEKYARSFAGYFLPPVLPVAAPLVAAAPAVVAAAGAGATVTTDHGNTNDMDDDVVTNADCLLSLSPEDIDSMMDFVYSSEY
ncbi:ethylene-responsive transcription factor ERF015-like [Phragmites australis]|uniref:ethylene-responsive transcription factor ERF015-like n=1 Tax=Phragmites australis TaxID=29695 RepID=UPI002D789DCD|nr:ethylene-responsive transcription factor ERF015-like [Phragmites australis]